MRHDRQHVNTYSVQEEHRLISIISNVQCACICIPPLSQYDAQHLAQHDGDVLWHAFVGGLDSVWLVHIFIDHYKLCKIVFKEATSILTMYKNTSILHIYWLSGHSSVVGSDTRNMSSSSGIITPVGSAPGGARPVSSHASRHGAAAGRYCAL